MAVYNNKYILNLSFSLEDPSLDSYLTLVSELEKRHKVLKQHVVNPKDINYPEGNIRNTAISAFYTLEIDGREVSVTIYYDKKSKVFPDGNISVSYLHSELSKFIIKKES